jgi:rare lipoprotein A (peptidoglycan hydrolase)
VTVEDLRNGHTISCVVTDREETRGDRAVDLSETQFAELAPLAVGVVPVRVTW